MEKNQHLQIPTRLDGGPPWKPLSGKWSFLGKYLSYYYHYHYHFIIIIIIIIIICSLLKRLFANPIQNLGAQKT